MNTTSYSPTYTKSLIADLKAHLAPFRFDPTCKGILETCDTGDLTKVALVVNVAIRERLIGSATIRAAIRDWVLDLNAQGGA